jgi:hypothetical protein
LREFENFVGSRFTPACNTSERDRTWDAARAARVLAGLSAPGGMGGRGRGAGGGGGALEPPASWPASLAVPCVL